MSARREATGVQSGTKSTTQCLDTVAVCRQRHRLIWKFCNLAKQIFSLSPEKCSNGKLESVAAIQLHNSPTIYPTIVQTLVILSPTVVAADSSGRDLLC